MGVLYYGVDGFHVKRPPQVDAREGTDSEIVSNASNDFHVLVLDVHVL